MPYLCFWDSTIAKYQQDAPPDPRMGIFVSEIMSLGLNEGIRNGVMPRSLDEEERVGVDSTHARGKSNVGIKETGTRRVRWAWILLFVWALLEGLLLKCGVVLIRWPVIQIWTEHIQVPLTHDHQLKNAQRLSISNTSCTPKSWPLTRSWRAKKFHVPVPLLQVGVFKFQPYKLKNIDRRLYSCISIMDGRASEKIGDSAGLPTTDLQTSRARSRVFDEF